MPPDAVRPLTEVLATQPWLLLGVYAAISAVVAVAIAGVVKRSLAELARRSPSNLTEIVSLTVPRPLGGAVFLAEISGGLRWLPLPAQLEALTRHLLPFALAILAVFLLMRMARRTIDAFGRSNPALRSTAGIARAVTWVAGLSLTILLLSDAIGFSLAPALTALGVGSLAVALALQDTLSNFFAGISIVTDKPVRPGDFVRLEGGPEGYVETLGWRSTHLRTLGGGVVVVPNSTLAKGVLTNFGAQNPRLWLRLRFDVALGSNVERVLGVLDAEAKAMSDVPGIERATAARALFLPGVNADAIGFTVVLQIEPTGDADRVEHEVRRRVAKALSEAGVAQPEPRVR